MFDFLITGCVCKIKEEVHCVHSGVRLQPRASGLNIVSMLQGFTENGIVLLCLFAVGERGLMSACPGPSLDWSKEWQLAVLLPQAFTISKSESFHVSPVDAHKV